MQLNQKETSLLKDLQTLEETCVEKYSKYSDESTDPQLKSLLKLISQKEQEHLNTINQIMGGTVPTLPQNGGGSTIPQHFTATYNATTPDPNKEKDDFFCTDLLATEKHASSVYDTCIFEFRDTKIRDDLNHIQKEEQEHGEALYNYMATNGMYNA